MSFCSRQKRYSEVRFDEVPRSKKPRNSTECPTVFSGTANGMSQLTEGLFARRFLQPLRQNLWFCHLPLHRGGTPFVCFADISPNRGIALHKGGKEIGNLGFISQTKKVTPLIRLPCVKGAVIEQSSMTEGLSFLKRRTDCHGGADKTLLLAMTESGNVTTIKYSVVYC